MIINNKKTVKVQRSYECGVSELFDHWQPEKMVSWWDNLKQVDFPKTVGEKTLFHWHSFDGHIEGKIKKFEANREIVFSWKSSNTENESLVRCVFEPSDLGSQLTIHHENNASFEEAADHDHGWRYCLEHLGKVVDSQPRKNEVVLTRTLNAPIEMVFDAWSQPEHVARWMNEGVKTQARCTLDLKVGGYYSLDHVDAKGDVHGHYGQYKVVDKPNRLVFSWLSDHTDGETEVEVELKKNGTRTDIKLTHRFFRDQKLADGHKEGWESIWAALDKIFQS